MLGARPVGLQELFDLQFNIKHGRGGAGLFYPRPPIFAIMSSPRQPNAQCPRTDDAPHNDSELQRDTSFWFEDGNVVVVAQQTAYRVHRGVLSRHSETFSGLFTLPRPVDGASDEKVEGCPGVRVTDSSHDFKHLLHALYDGLGYMDSVPELERNSMYASLARLGHKYELGAVFSAALQRLRATTTKSGGGSGPGPPATGNNLLPTALYHCTLRPIAALLDGERRADGTLEQLSREDLGRCLEARDVYKTRGAHFWSQPWQPRIFVEEPPPDCTSWDLCKRSITATREYPLTMSSRLLLNVFLIVKYHEEIVQSGLDEECLCGACVDRVSDEIRRLAEAQWDALPKALKLTDVVTEWPRTVPSQ
ncbi:hypothetical protein OH76DRAFT_1555286 [Lentinus brumalis]|uniref:BTB domain-containing protein n=1 Tax=Lentinus brumalis TaxID=2498619 RepID=A0A371DF58_9APHY|nr:hypothetical protein OH76DRAFT_1555286 [Polyporus brumalis]